MMVTGGQKNMTTNPLNQTGGYGKEIGTLKDNLGISEYKKFYDSSLDIYLWEAYK